MLGQLAILKESEPMTATPRFVLPGDTDEVG